MPVTLTFYTPTERKPENGDLVMLLTSWYELSEASVTYVWEEIDPEDGRPTGADFVYVEGDEPPPNTRLLILFDGYGAGDVLWAPVEVVRSQWRSFIEENDTLRGR